MTEFRFHFITFYGSNQNNKIRAKVSLKKKELFNRLLESFYYISQRALEIEKSTIKPKYLVHKAQQNQH